MAEICLLPEPAWNDDDVYQIFALRYGSAPERRVHGNFMLRDMHDGPMPLDFYIWIVRNRHRTMLVDTGFSPRAAEARGRPIDIDPVEALTTLGLPPEAIGDVVITHLHFDHAGNIGRFEKSRLHVQDSEVAYATGRCMCHAHMRMHFDVEDVVALVRHTYAERVRFVDGDAALQPGVTLHALPGHSKGVQAVRVKTPRGDVILASDVIHFYANLARSAPHWVTIDTAETFASYERLLRLAGGDIQRIIPGHDPKTRRFYPKLMFAGLELLALHEAPTLHTIEMLKRVDDF
jgi:glyoxylase-like metal-dependent hydrolase (beta-lactamase superfamily II)